MSYHIKVGVREVKKPVAAKRAAIAGKPAVCIFAMNNGMGRTAFMFSVDKDRRWVESRTIYFMQKALENIGTSSRTKISEFNANFEADQVRFFEIMQFFFLQNYPVVVVQNFLVETCLPTHAPTNAPTDAGQFHEFIGCYQDNVYRDVKEEPMASGYNVTACRAGGHCGLGNAYTTAPTYTKRPDSD
jgi:hypothetical protein